MGWGGGGGGGERGKWNGLGFCWSGQQGLEGCYFLRKVVPVNNNSCLWEGQLPVFCSGAQSWICQLMVWTGFGHELLWVGMMNGCFLVLVNMNGFY